MKAFLYENMLLFSIRRRRWSFLYELYFAAAETLSSPRPELFCFTARASSVAELHLGVVYDIEAASSGALCGFAQVGSNRLDQSSYAWLLSLRDREYALGGTPHLPATVLPMEDADRIVHSREAFMEAAVRYVLFALAGLVAALLPFILYTVIIMVSASALSGGHGVLAQSLTIPFITFGSLPLVFFGVLALEYAFQRLFLSWGFTAGFMIRRRCVHTGGYRPVLSAVLPSNRTLRIGAVSSIALLVVSILLTLVIGAF